RLSARQSAAPTNRWAVSITTSPLTTCGASIIGATLPESSRPPAAIRRWAPRCPRLATRRTAPRPRGALFGGRRRSDRQVHREEGSLAGAVASRLDGAAVQLHEVTG